MIYISQSKIRRAQFIRKGDIVLAASSGSKKVIGKNILFEDDYEGSFGAFCKAVRPKTSLYYSYLKHFFKTPYYRKTIQNVVQGANINNLRNEHIDNLLIPLPEQIEDQIGIATLLSRAEALIAKRKESIRLLDDLVKSTFLEMFGDPVRNDKGWEKEPLSKLGTLDRGVSKHRPRNAPELLGGPYPLIQTGDVANAGLYIRSYNQTYSEIGLKQSKLWPKRTLCITIAANIAKTAILNFDACFPDSVVGFTSFPEESHPIYVHYLFKFFQRILEKNAPQAAQKNINLQILRNLPVPKPHIREQDTFVKLVQKVESLKTKYEACLQELENLYGSLAQRAFRGELDLNKVPIVHEVHVHDAVHLHDATSPTVVIEKTTKFELSFEVVKELISKKLPKQFTFEALWGKMNELLLDNENHEDEETLDGKGLQHYEAVRKIVYKMLNDSRPFLKQTFNKESKEIVLELAR